MAPKKVLYSLLAMALGLSTTVHAQDNPGVCPQDNGKYRTAQDGISLLPMTDAIALENKTVC